MNNFIQHITRRLVDLLPEDDSYYRLTDLKEYGFPVFITHRIKIELERNLAESIVPPQTDWANMHSEKVQAAWNNFVDAIRAEVRLPASYAQPVIETAVADVMEMLVQPRKNIPEVIYGNADELEYENIKFRVEAVTVYRHFATVLPRYMEKKGLDTLTKERCRKVVSDTDGKLTASYSPLNWAQMLEPLFNLLDEQIDTDLLRMFFEDKKMPRIARHFDLMDDAVNRAELIEVLSSPELLDFEGYEEPQPDLFNEEGKKESKMDEAEVNREEPVKEEEKEDKDSGEESDKELPDVVEEFHRRKEQEVADEEEADDVNDEAGEEPLNKVFSAGEEEEPPLEEDEDASSINYQFTGESEEPESSASEVSSDRSITIEESDEADEEESPMWKRFMSPEQHAELEEKEEPETDEEGFIDEPIIDLTKDDEPDEGEVEALFQLLDDDRERFIEEIFRGSEQAFEDAVQEIANKDNWRSVSKFIEEEIFKRNLVDMYSETAVDFTDRLQSYFLEKSKS